MFDESCRRLRLFEENEEIHHQTLEELARRKKHNLELLRMHDWYNVGDSKLYFNIATEYRIFRSKYYYHVDHSDKRENESFISAILAGDIRTS